MAKNASSDPIITPPCRLGFPNLFEPRPPLNGQGEPKYTATLLFDKGADLTPLKKAVRDVVVKQWGPDKAKWPKGLKLPFRDQGEKADKYDGFVPGCIFINASKTAKYGRPGVVDERLGLVTDPARAYPGANIRAEVTVFAYTTPQAGVSVGLNHVQLLGGGERMGNQTDPTKAFTPVESAAGGAAESADDIFGETAPPDSTDDEFPF